MTAEEVESMYRRLRLKDENVQKSKNFGLGEECFFVKYPGFLSDSVNLGQSLSAPKYLELVRV